MKKARFAIFIMLTLALSSCSQLVIESLGVESGDLLFRDGFSDTRSGWDRVQNSGIVADYAGGTYRMFIDEPNLDIWSNPGMEFDDVIVEVDATKAGGPDDNNFGVICRSSPDADQFYYFVISSDGYYAIGKVRGKTQILFGEDVMQPSHLVRQGYAMNHIRAECIGNSLALSVNGESIAEVSDNEFQTGDIGLIAGTFEVPGVDIYFDNFQVTKP